MILLGIDPGSRATGYGVIRLQGNHLRHIAHGAIRTNDKDTFPQRLHVLNKGLQAVIREYQPQSACIENLFLSQNPQSALKLGHARGVLILTCLQEGVEVVELSALQIKQSVTGYGKAPKEQVGKMVTMLLGLSNPPTSADAADALAGAIALSQILQTQQRIAR
ncbi:crossover junction endodeoxyribonuclease RuvC [Chrysiogenes arsenatis]|uniref:crossover junction endodeoxyribonuclease RuvC n=1 Tax=Chrysiogenes arsenatis TaxID=309797 RepID=UPI0004219861|nr:crossover junction endodeoxyribonuclease RuvC [Chrysiogenes arsenatis]